MQIKLHKNHPAAVVFLLILLLVFFIYHPGFYGALYYDDIRPLSKLFDVHDLESAIDFILTESSGPLGRPLAMLSFLPHASSWPNGVDDILFVNVLIHLMNGLLVALLVYKIALIRECGSKKSEWIAIAVASLWLLLPLQISSSLIAIQRMATLSAFFVLSGILVYVHGVTREKEGGKNGALFQYVGVFCFSFMAILAKENGILLPVFILVIEATLLANFQTGSLARRNIKAFSWLLTFFVFCYLIHGFIKNSGDLGGREFSIVERVQTQPLILFSYLSNAFFPRPYNLHPFHDGFPKVGSLSENPVALFSLFACFLLAFFSILLKRRYQVASFAVIFFISAHLLESTTLNLELYFEHRNYVALIGPCFGLVWSLQALSQRYKAIIIPGFVLYLIILATISYYVTSLWGDRISAAETWFVYSFKSPRAAEHLALIYLESNRFEDAYHTIKMQAEDCPNCLSSLVQAAMLSCAAGDKERTEKYFQQAKNLALSTKNVGGAATTLSALHNSISDNRCAFIDHKMLYEINRDLLVHQTSGLGALNRKIIHINLQRIAKEANNDGLAISHLIQAWAADNDYALGEAVFNLLIEQGSQSDAKIFYETQLCSKFPLHPYLAYKISSRCKELRFALKNN